MDREARVPEGAQEWLGMLQTLAQQIQRQQQNSQQMVQQMMDTYMQLLNTPGSYLSGQAEQQQQTLQQTAQQWMEQAQQQQQTFQQQAQQQQQAFQQMSQEVLKDRKSTRLNSSHANISYAVFCLKKKTKYLISVTSSPVTYPYLPRVSPPHPHC